MNTDDIFSSRGAAYTSSQVAEWSHYHSPIDSTPGRPSGFSRRHGDASLDVQQQAIDAIVAAGRAKGMSDDLIAMTLAIARHESGFNPDAAAGPTSASGLGQFINRTGSAYGLSDDNRWNMDAQARALVDFTSENITLARSRGISDSELHRWVYKFHHDGPEEEYGGLQIADRAVIPLIPRYRRYLQKVQGTQEYEPSISDLEPLQVAGNEKTLEKITSAQLQKIDQDLSRLKTSPMSENQTKIQTAKVSHKNSVSHSGNVLINGRTAVHAGSCATLTTVDVCRTQIGPAVVNIPYTNIAKSSDAANTAATVFINGHPVCTKNSCFAKSIGDEAGNRQGLHSGTIMGKADFITASPNVYIEGIAAVRNGDLMVSNNRNTAPM
ncbi:MAG: PAAR-like domain-containing protein, partial [Desulfuromonadales bacterium]|nr:PAAR-like domain-containing protein [Desulfuromonadales bacterium]